MDASEGSREPRPATVPTRSSARGPLIAFALDAAIVLVTMFGVSLACGIAWGMMRAITQARAGLAIDPAHIGEPGPAIVLCIAVVGTASAALLVYLWRRRADAHERAISWRNAGRRSTWSLVAMTAAATCVVSIGVNLLGSRAGIEAVPTNVALLRDSLQHRPWLLWIVAVLLAPVYEELLFRRVLFGRLWAAGYPVLGAALSAALFALLHELPGQSGNSLPATVLLWLGYGFMGLAFAWVYRRTGTLWAPIAAHALNNLIACLLMIVSN